MLGREVLVFVATQPAPSYVTVDWRGLTLRDARKLRSFHRCFELNEEGKFIRKFCKLDLSRGDKHEQTFPSVLLPLDISFRGSFGGRHSGAVSVRLNHSDQGWPAYRPGDRDGSH